MSGITTDATETVKESAPSTATKTEEEKPSLMAEEPVPETGDIPPPDAEQTEMTSTAKKEEDTNGDGTDLPADDENKNDEPSSAQSVISEAPKSEGDADVDAADPNDDGTETANVVETDSARLDLHGDDQKDCQPAAQGIDDDTKTAKEPGVEEEVEMVLPLTAEEIKKGAREQMEVAEEKKTPDPSPSDNDAAAEEETAKSDETAVDPEEMERIERRNELNALLIEAKEEAADLRSYNFHLLQQIAGVIRRNNGSLGLDDEVPSTMNPLTASASNLESKQNELYEAVLKEVEYLHSEYSAKQKEYNDKIMELNDRVIEHDEQAITLKNTYKNFKRKICKKLNKKSGTSTKIETKWILQKEEEEEELDSQIEQERLKNIHYDLNLKKLSLKIKEKDKLSDGLHLIDFEQLKIENQTLNEKIEERNDELYKLKKKITNTVQILTHFKEKLQFIHKINQNLAQKQTLLDDVVNEKRDTLNELKKKRDLLRCKNAKLKQKQGFIANDVLVIDFQETKNGLKAKQQELDQIKERYETLQKTIKLAETLKKSMLRQTA